MEKKSSRKTAIMTDDPALNASRATSIMGGDSRRTSLMESPSGVPIAFSLSVGQTVCDLLITRVISENTGEATLLLGSDSDTKFVLKIYHQNKQPKDDLLRMISEIESPYITRPVRTGMIQERYFEVLPYYSRGDLASLNASLSLEDLEQIIIPSVNEGLKALHDKNIVHRDIKPDNLFLNEAGNLIVIGDFGISSTLNTRVSVRATTTSRTLGYAAPETSSGYISKESDYYSFGIALLHLVTGQDPFAGMTDTQILYQTINNKVNIPTSLDKRFISIIRGLTLKERSDRWGYSEVKKWLNKETVEIKESKVTKGIKPYLFNKEKYFALEDLGKALALDWANAKKHLFRGLVEQWLVQFGEDYASACIDLKELKDQDVAVFRLIYLLSPESPLCYKGRFYNDLEHLAKCMYEELPTQNPDNLEMLTNGCFEYYLKLDDAYDENLVNAVSVLLEQIQAGKNEFYYALMYLLNPNIGFTYGDNVFLSIQDISSFLLSLDEDDEKKCARTLLRTPFFPMWVVSLGYGKIVQEWLRVYENEVW